MRMLNSSPAVFVGEAAAVPHLYSLALKLKGKGLQSLNLSASIT